MITFTGSPPPHTLPREWHTEILKKSDLFRKFSAKGAHQILFLGQTSQNIKLLWLRPKWSSYLSSLYNICAFSSLIWKETSDAEFTVFKASSIWFNLYWQYAFSNNNSLKKYTELVRITIQPTKSNCYHEKLEHNHS